MLRLHRLCLGYDSRTLIEEAETSFSAGTLTALIGRNGTGKSTLLRALAGIGVRPEGEILIGDTSLDQLSPLQRARSIAFVTTERIRISDLRCRDVVALGRAPHTDWIGRLQEEDRRVVDEALEAVGMSAYADRTMESLSDGESQRVMIARALAQQTPIVLLDEPTSFLDLPNRYELVRLLQRLAHERNKCILFSTHELDIALSLCDTVALIDPPQLVHLPVEEMIRSGRIERLFALPDFPHYLKKIVNCARGFVKCHYLCTKESVFRSENHSNKFL